jgi:hypothetical protein
MSLPFGHNEDKLLTTGDLRPRLAVNYWLCILHPRRVTIAP